MDMDFAEARYTLESHLVLAIQVARHTVHKMRAGGTLIFIGGTGAEATQDLVSALRRR